jgi:hypothetical protein
MKTFESYGVKELVLGQHLGIVKGTSAYYMFKGLCQTKVK